MFGISKVCSQQWSEVILALSWRSRHSEHPTKWASGGIEKNVWTVKANGKLTPKVQTFLGIGGTRISSEDQITGSESHPKSPSGGYRSGGPFYTSKSGVSFPMGGGIHTVHEEHLFGGGTQYTSWDGGRTYYPASSKTLFDNIDPPEARSTDLSDLDQYGTTAISSCSPANPASEVGTGVSELYREGVPLLPGVHTWRDRTRIAKAAGGEYLNYQFGWVPLESEVNNFASVVRRHRDILNQYSRNAGTNVRRQFNFPLESVAESEVVEEGRCTVDATTTNGWTFAKEKGKVTITRGREIKRWFSGAFTYDVPSQTDSWRRALGYGSDADVLFGASLNPTLLWNLTPWSWAVDWFSNTGDVINNLSNYIRAGQVLRYGYIMEENYSYVNMSMDSSGYEGMEPPAPVSKYTVTKVRRPATPYGFGIDLEGLSPTQIAISVALGLTLL